MADRSALVTVGLPTYNGLDLLPRAIESVLNQDYRQIELVICDNASTDETESYCRALAAQHPSIRYIRHAENVGVTENFNRARSAATGRYFMWLGDDDWLDDDYVSRCVELLERDPTVVLACGEVRYYESGKHVRTGKRVTLRQARGAGRVVGYYRGVSDNGVFYGVIRRTALEQLPPLKTRMGDDWYLIAGLAFLGAIVSVDGVAVHRGLGGVSRSLANVALVAGHSRIEREWPQVAIAGWAARDIGWESPVYRPLGRFRRLAVGGMCAVIVFVRFVPRKVPKYLRLKWEQIRGESQRMERERST
ncbi:MAG: glycosyltransferase family 2 protein [Acidimicrobiia bacterium]